MEFRKNTEDFEKFLADEPYYVSSENYCLGNSLPEAAEIIKKIMYEKEKNEGACLCGIG